MLYNTRTTVSLCMEQDINKKLVEDLDGLYFYDKIHMKSQSIIEIPKLDFNFDKMDDNLPCNWNAKSLHMERISCQT